MLVLTSHDRHHQICTRRVFSASRNNMAKAMQRQLHLAMSETSADPAHDFFAARYPRQSTERRLIAANNHT